MFTVEYSINFGCHEFVSDETLGIFEKESEAMCFWANQINMAHPIDFDDADAEIDSWDIQEGDYEYGEFYGGQINLCERTPNNYRNILHADFARDIKTKRTALDEMSVGEDAFDFEKELAVKLNCMRKL